MHLSNPKTTLIVGVVTAVATALPTFLTPDLPAAYHFWVNVVVASLLSTAGAYELKNQTRGHEAAAH